ncbi:MAG: (2Fe-2S)-binding protein [Actinobacteria bacterium]|nr:(2Fe-2S)-binding protein [Actinomycetota bacterium]
MIHEINFVLNGEEVSCTVSARRLLIHVLRDDLGLRGPKIGCDTGHCGACTIRYNGVTIKSCMMLAVQADGAEIETVESLASDGELSPLQEAFHEHHALQCGYCTSGMLMSSEFLLERNPSPSDEEIREGISGNICRCTGYMHIVEAVRDASKAGRRVEA